MTKVLAGAAAIAGVGIFGVLVAANLRLGNQVADLESRLAQVEGRRKESAPGVDASKVVVNARPVEPSSAGTAAYDDLAKQVATLKSTVDSLKKEAPAAEATLPLAGPGGADAPGGPKLAMNDEQRKALEQAVEDVLKKREEAAQKERQARMEEVAKERMNQIMDEMAEKVGLTPQQRDSIQPIVAGAMKQVMDLWQGRRDTGQKDAMGNVIVAEVPEKNRREEMGKILADADTKIKSQLTVEQTGTYEEWRKTNGPRFGMPMGGRVIFGPGGPGGPQPGGGGR